MRNQPSILVLDPHNDFVDTPHKKAHECPSRNSTKNTPAHVLHREALQPKNQSWGKAIATNIPIRKKVDCKLLIGILCPMC